MEKMLVSSIYSFAPQFFQKTSSSRSLTLSSIYTHFNTMKEKTFVKKLWKMLKLIKMSNLTFFHNVFYAICILKTFNNHISVVVCSFFEFGTVSKWCIKEWVKTDDGLVKVFFHQLDYFLPMVTFKKN